ncbi:MAG: hypothetical protein JWL76_2243 [Thermoleophilia bacterium]|nr:hypothetical protein [Thermoleophilia bacterium]
MRLIQPFPGGTLEGARAHLVNAQGFAANVANNPSVDALKNLTEGVASAKKAAAELFMAPPRSDFQDLVAARQQVLAGAQLLQQAVSVLSNFGGDLPADPTPHVKGLAGQAFDAFEAAFEIIDND